MNRPSPDDMKQIMMAEKRAKNKKLKNGFEWLLFAMVVIIPMGLYLLGYYGLL